MKYANSNGGQNYAAAMRATTSRRPPVNSDVHHHTEHTAVLDTLTSLLKDEIRKGLNLMDACVSHLAQAKWVLMNVDKTMEDFYADCPACKNSKKKSNGASTSGQQQNKLKVFPMVSGHTVQRPKINVTRIEQQKKEPLVKPKTPIATANLVPGVIGASVAQAGPSRANPSRGFKVGANRKRGKGRIRRRAPIKKSTGISSSGPSVAAPPFIAIATSSAAACRQASPAVPVGNNIDLDNSNLLKRPGPKSKTQVTYNDMLAPPVLTREGNANADSDNSAPVTNGKVDSSKSQSSSTNSSPYKMPPVLTPYNSVKLRISSISLKNQDNDSMAATSELVAPTTSSSTHGGTAVPPKSNEPLKSAEVFDRISKLVAATSAAIKRPMIASSSESPHAQPTKQGDKKMKVNTKVNIPVVDDKPDMQVLLQLKYQKFREQQRKKELNMKADERQAAGKVKENSSYRFVEEITIIDDDNNENTQEQQEIKMDCTTSEPDTRDNKTDKNEANTPKEDTRELENIVADQIHSLDDCVKAEEFLAGDHVFSPDELRSVGVDVEAETARCKADWPHII